MKGASNWLTSLPIKEENYVINKREFYDAIRMRYRGPLKFIPTTCACGETVLGRSCIVVSQRRLRTSTPRRNPRSFWQTATEISNDVEIEPNLLPLTGEQLHATANGKDEARLDISTGSFC
ncbi:Hypothetical predicted protein [Paramuricea clavata]|uniref:Uncharacterized protein n=1 Tax=Paramuricea clavata TaxID=317549 RepID=A0A7D9IAF1_PARCT|nr:Hypothetical predicted protein [Paramuricea clavata]